MLSPAAHPDQPAATGLDLRAVTRADRTRLSGPALRTFARIADAWSLAERDRLAALGEPGRSTYHAWLAKARAGRPVCLPLDTLLRLSGLLGIHKSLQIIFARPSEDVAWLHSANDAPTFGGQPPIALVTSGFPDGILLVRRYLDAWRGGQAAAPIEGAPFEHEPIADDDLVFA